MLSEVAQQLIRINRTFYQEYAGAFAATRRRIQPGIYRVLSELATENGRYLDLGCGSGALAETWAASGPRGLYLGLDFSEGLLEEARRTTRGLDHPGLEIKFEQADLTDPAWVSRVPAAAGMDGILAFAVLHHIPGKDQRRFLLNQIRSLVKQNGIFILSVWQFHNSPKWMTRCLQWETLDIDPSRLEEGDYLLDWRHTLPDQSQKPGLRYVHLFSPTELKELASETGFTVINEFESDGQGGRLGLYQIWLAK